MLGRVADESAPAAADIEEAIAGLQPQLAADHVELVELRAGEIVVPVGLKIRAGIDHLGVEEEPIEGVRHVVMIGDVLLVGLRSAVARDGVVLHPIEGAGHGAGRAPEVPRGLERLALAQTLEPAADLALRALRREIENGAVLEIEQARHMGIDERCRDWACA